MRSSSQLCSYVRYSNRPTFRLNSQRPYGWNESTWLSSLPTRHRSGCSKYLDESMWSAYLQWRAIAKLSIASLFFTIIVFFFHLSSSIQQRNEALYIEYRRLDESSVGEATNSDVTAPTSHAGTDVTEILGLQSSTAADERLNDTLLIQGQRQKHLKAVCDSLQLKPLSPKQYRIAMRQSGVFYVDDRLRYIYCMVPKAACTTWTRVLLIASGQIHKLHPNAITQGDAHRYRVSGRIMRPLARYSIKDIQFRLKHYFKFMFVRHPLDRLSSAFRDRLKSDHKLPKQLYNRLIVDKYRDNQTTGRLKDVQFHEFVRFIVDPINKPDDFNFHWKPQFHLCLPCHVNYDFIGHQETLSADADVVLKRLGPRAAKVQFPTVDPDNKLGSRQAATSQGLKTNWTAKLASKYAHVSADDIDKLRTAVYAEDFNVFGYD